ncbi:MAG TPA: sulfotransferase, partial [Phycisphaerales bacterium]|nr:sulfotransferase [Phycisphaerales bacterium]
GGTLMATILDAHPNISMGYELYEHLFEPRPEEGLTDIQELITQVSRTIPKNSWLKSKQTPPVNPQVVKLLARIRRGGVNEETFLLILEEFALQGGDIRGVGERLQILENTVRFKMEKEGKTSWGAKISKRLKETAILWPESCFIFMMRDGRDIAASRKNNGNFKHTIEQVALGYAKQTKKFKQFAKHFGSKAVFVQYESLVTEPENTLRSLCESINLEWSHKLLNHNKEDLTIYKDPAGHLSAKQIKQPINSNSIGRWKKDLTEAEVSGFELVAGDTLEEFGYSCTRIF